jgi:hypothetical protein
VIAKVAQAEEKRYQKVDFGSFGGLIYGSGFYDSDLAIYA